MKRFAALCCVSVLAGCTSAALPWQETPKDRFTAGCSAFYDGVSVLATQRLVGNISDETYREVNPYVESGHALCQDPSVQDYNGALVELEEALTMIAIANKESAE